MNALFRPVLSTDQCGRITRDRATDRPQPSPALQPRRLLVALLIFFCASALNAANIPALVRQAKPAVVQIVTFDHAGVPLYTGTGFFISADGVLLTNYHVISGARRIIAKTSSGTVYALKRICGYSEAYDVAELQFVTPKVPFLTMGPSADAVEGQRVLVIGNPEGLEGTVSDGIIAAFRGNRSLIQITAPISPGSSGSPVLNEFGQAIGIATSIFKEGQNLNLAISSETVRDAIAQALSVTPNPTPIIPATVTPSARSKKSEKASPRASPAWTPPATDKPYVAPGTAPVEPPSSASEVIRMVIPGRGITLILPADWEDIPPTTLEEYKNVVARLSANPTETRKTSTNYVFAAQRKGAENYFAFPYLIVDVLNTGRVSSAHFQDLGNPMAQVAPQIEKLFPTILKAGKGTTMTYDSATNRFWWELTMKVREDNCHALSTTIPTELGFVNIYFYSTEKEFNSWSPIFSQDWHRCRTFTFARLSAPMDGRPKGQLGD
jgi:S1-C subfamily serine protease